MAKDGHPLRPPNAPPVGSDPNPELLRTGQRLNETGRTKRCETTGKLDLDLRPRHRFGGSNLNEELKFVTLDDLAARHPNARYGGRWPPAFDNDENERPEKRQSQRQRGERLRANRDDEQTKADKKAEPEAIAEVATH